MQDRKNFIGGSDAKRILDGDWLSLYREKIGEIEPEDLTHNFKVRLGELTEFFHIDWLNTYHGFEIEPPKERIHHPQHHQIAALIDGWCHQNCTFVEVKHSHGGATRDNMIEWYQPQIAHYCNILEMPAGWLSYIAGNSEPDFFKLAPTTQYRDELLEHELRFWWHVENRIPPDIIPAASLARTRDEAAKACINDMRAVSMHGNNEWASHACAYLETEQAATTFEQAKKALKGMVEADVREASGHGITIKRSKSGALLLSRTKEPAS